jgi:catechol 2,3-dioxygenase
MLPMKHPVIGHVHLKVSDLDRSIAFYRDVLGLELQQMYGSEAAFLSFGGHHHHVGLNVWQSKGGSPAPAGSTGLFHFAILYPSRKDLAAALQRLIDHKVRLTGAADHGVSEALYLNDPDGNGVELYADRPEEEWPREQGKINMVTNPLDLDDLLRELEGQPQ